MKNQDIKKISIIIPIYNEKENISECIERLNKVLMNLSVDFEILCVDDGSVDGSTDILFGLAKEYSCLKVIQLRRNYGQTAALSAGLNFAQGEIIVTMDADLQNRPEDIPKLLNLIEKGYDVVCGWRKKRKDKLITRIIPSYIANKIISFVTGVKLHDYGCTLRVYKREFIREVKLYGEMHRFLPALLCWVGASIVEIEVEHAPRVRGKSKYGILRTFKVMLDLVTVKLLISYSTKPIYLFGGIGLFLLLAGFGMFLIVTYRVLFLHNLSATPLIFIMVILVISAIQMILTGLLAEINIRTFFEAKDKQIYHIKNKVNL